MPDYPAFRHDPRKSTLALGGPSGPASLWCTEPAVCGYVRLTHESKRAGRTVPVPVCATPAVVMGVGVVVAAYDGTVTFHSRALDKVFWRRWLDSPVYASLVVDPARSTIVVAATSGRVVCLDLRAGVVWSAEADAPIYATPTVLPGSDVLVVAAFGSRCLGFDLATGRLAFSRCLPEPWHAALDGSAAHRDPYASPTATASGNAVVGCAEHVVALSPEGDLVWQHEVGSAVRASPAALDATGQVAVCAVDGRCLFLDEGTGESRGEVALGAKITSSPAVSGDVLAIGTHDDEAVGVGIRARDVIWRSRQGAPRDHSSFSVLPDGNFVATSRRGNVVGTGRDDGRFLWESSQLLGLAEHDPALDTTPIAAPDGSMYAGSYSGAFYHFRFRPADECSADDD